LPLAKMAGSESTSAALAVVVLIFAMVIPILLLLRTQRKAAADQEAAKDAREAAAAAAEEKRLAKAAERDADKGGSRKKKGGLSRMKAAQERAAPATGADAQGDAAYDDEGPTSKQEQRKADKRAGRDEEREYRNAERDAIKEREEKKSEARRAKEEEREEAQRMKEEAEQKRQEEEAKRKQAEYDQWKDMFSVEDGGELQGVEEEDEGLLCRFVEHIKAQKVSTLDELAGKFSFKVHDVVNRLQGLEQMGYITGVVDDRGKFIFIAQEELEAVARHLKKKGRLRISALAQESNRLIDLQPRKIESLEDAEDEGGEATTATGA